MMTHRSKLTVALLACSLVTFPASAEFRDFEKSPAAAVPAGFHTGLTGGEQQRVALATKGRLLERVRRLSHEERFTLLLVTHDPLEAIGLCDHAMVLEQGRLIESGPFQELLDSPRSEILRLFRERMSGLSLR